MYSISPASRRLYAFRHPQKNSSSPILETGRFLDLLGSWRLEVYLDWLKAEDLLPHYSAVDPLYWSTVDIIDSIISHAALSHLQSFHMELKADLFDVLAYDIDDIADLFGRYRYPDVGEANRMAFMAELLRRLKEREALLDEFGFQLLKGVLQAGTGAEPLLYLQDKAPGTLIDSFVEFFICRLCLFKNAVHVLDTETVIQQHLKACVFRDDERNLDTFRFVDSQAEPGVQVSDALIGLLGKLFSYVTRASPAQLVVDRRALTPSQIGTLAKLNTLLDRSNQETSALFHQVASIKAMRGAQFFLEGR
jgi:hypothetical protein